MKLTPDEALELSKKCKKYYKASVRYSNFLESEHFNDTDDEWNILGYDLEQKLIEAKDRLDKHLSKLIKSKK